MSVRRMPLLQVGQFEKKFETELYFRSVYRHIAAELSRKVGQIGALTLELEERTLLAIN